MAFLPYHEPSITVILIQSSFLFLLNIVKSILDYALYCGLLGQVLLGVAWGVPGVQLLGDDAQRLLVQLGYLGLILLVYEGGLSVPMASLKANLRLSIGVALTGVAAPMGLSFVLMPLMDATALQSFAAGAALCSTSLGTTFTVLSTSGLTNTRLGVVLSTAAMIDDVLGLVIVQIISNLGSQSTEISASVVVRPLLVSLAFAVVVPLVCKYLIGKSRAAISEKALNGKVKSVCQRRQIRLVLHLLLLFGLVAAGSYAGTSNLFTAYMAGAVVNWWDSSIDRPHSSAPAPQSGNSSAGKEEQKDKSSSTPPPTHTGPMPVGRVDCSIQEPSDNQAVPSLQSRDPRAQHTTHQDSTNRSDQLETSSHGPAAEELSGRAIYAHYLSQPVNRILKPFFFASIGFSIPVASLFQGPLIWRGLVYSTLMALGKLVCGLWLVHFPSVRSMGRSVVKGWVRFYILIHHLLPKTSTRSITTEQRPGQARDGAASHGVSLSDIPNNAEVDDAMQATNSDTTVSAPLEYRTAATWEPTVSLYPAVMLGSAMVARGEIGFLIASVAESNGIWHQASFHRPAGSSKHSSAIFIVTIWAIVLCTFLGPVAVGLIVRRVKALEKGKLSNGRGGRNALGRWRIGE